MNLNKFWITQRDKFTDKVDNRDLNPSGLTFFGVKMCEILLFRNISDGSSFYFQLSDDIKNKKAVINAKNTDNKYFMWSVPAALHPQDIHPERIAKNEQWENDLSFKGITFPVPVSKVQKFEEMNNIKVNVCTQTVWWNPGSTLYTAKVRC